jgi:hypothetical protein
MSTSTSANPTPDAQTAIQDICPYIDVIRAENLLIEGASVWLGTNLVLIRGETCPDSVEKYIALRVGITTNVSSLSEYYGVSPEEVRYLNNLGTNEEIIQAGRWIIIPATVDRKGYLIR